MKGAALIQWATDQVAAYWTEWDATKRPMLLEQYIARAYLKGAIDALKEETERIVNANRKA